MTYKELGLKCGIEIHQQLEGKKLFCSCPTRIRDEQASYVVKRKLRAVAGESGQVDIASAQEQARDRTLLYEVFDDSTCLVELDEEPPHEINQEALSTVLQFCKVVQAEVSPVVQVMRKTITDGSITSGFQRTVLLARNGFITLSNDTVIRINAINLEEDSARNMHTGKENETVFRLDRLGIPLIEITTMPDITSSEQCQEAAKKIGMLLRSLPGVKRGLGTIRQDVNVSIKGGERIEIKGAQDLKMLPTLVELECKRQEELLKIKDELKKQKLNTLEIIDLTQTLRDCQCAKIKSAKIQGGKVFGFRLEKFAGKIGRELQPGYRLGTELAGRAKIIAGVGGIFHSDELPNYGITDADVQLLCKALLCKEGDAFILVADEENKARKALHAISERVKELWHGVPAEVRKAHADGTTRSLRPMPGAARMYPETDVDLIKPILSNVKIPELLEEKQERYQKDYNLSADLAHFVAKSDHFLLFDELAEKYQSIKPAFIADMLVSIPLEIKRKYGLEPDKLTDDDYRTMLAYLTEDKIHKDIMLDVMIDFIKGTFDIKKYESLGTEEIHKTIKEIIEQNPGAPMGALMGKCVKALGGKASGQMISQELKKILEKGHK